jgi:hypothetical protein
MAAQVFFSHVLPWCSNICVLVTIIGLIVKKRYRYCITFLAYLAVVFGSDLAITFWPEQFYTRRFWFAKELVSNALIFAVGLELGFRVVREFPGARSSARLVVVVVMIATTLAVLPVWPGDTTHLQESLAMQSRFLNGAVWLFSALAAVILWYRLPILWFQKALIVGFVPYLLGITAGMNLLQSATAPETWAAIRPAANNAMTVTFVALVTYWAYLIWRPAPDPVQVPEPPTAAKRVTQPL